jgi:outer membrane protein OmpA-like peptidoglycan-associated protein
MRWAIPLLIVVFGLGGLWLRSAIRWDRGIAALKAEPGIVVVDADRGWRSWDISGMRDPIARDPRAVLAAVGINPRVLKGKWVSYLSLDSSIAALRSRNSVDSIARSIESDRILFAAGSSLLDQAALARLASLAVRYRQLEDVAVQSGGSVRLELVGRTDPSGADETNATLAASRVNAVASWLESLGIEAGRLSHNALATARPLNAQDSLERARINRSVSFDVSVTTVTRTGTK